MSGDELAELRRSQLVQALGWNADAQHTYTDALEGVRILRDRGERVAQAIEALSRETVTNAQDELVARAARIARSLDGSEPGALGNPHPPSAEDKLVEFLAGHVGCCVVMAAKGDLARALLAAGYRLKDAVEVGR